jgi:hypothetical protein
MTLNDAASWAQVLWFGAVTLGTTYGGFKLWFKFTAKLDNLEKYTYRENGGSSLKDALNRLEKGLAENTKLTNKAFSAIAKLEGKLENHIEEGGK